MPLQNRISKTLSLMLLVFWIGACSSVQTNQSQSQKPQPKTISASDLNKLRWIEGSWRGTGDIDKPFYERYKFENDTTLVVESFPDERFETANDIGRFELKDGHFGSSSNGAGSVASSLDDNSITFEPTGKARNSYRWQRESADSWKAVLNWKEADGTPKERVYKMERWPPAK
jgi:hypothetical protein